MSPVDRHDGVRADHERAGRLRRHRARLAQRECPDRLVGRDALRERLVRLGHPHRKAREEEPQQLLTPRGLGGEDDFSARILR